MDIRTLFAHGDAVGSSTALNSGLRSILIQVEPDRPNALGKSVIALHRIMFCKQSLKAPILPMIRGVAGVHISSEDFETVAMSLYTAVQIITISI